MVVACQEVLDNTEHVAAKVLGYPDQIPQTCVTFASSTVTQKKNLSPTSAISNSY